MPIFVNELYAIKLTIKNNEDNAIENLKLSVSFKPNESESVDISNTSKQRCVSSSQIVSFHYFYHLVRVWIGQIDKQTWQTQQTKPIANIQSKQQVNLNPNVVDN